MSAIECTPLCDRCCHPFPAEQLGKASLPPVREVFGVCNLEPEDEDFVRACVDTKRYCSSCRLLLNVWRWTGALAKMALIFALWYLIAKLIV